MGEGGVEQDAEDWWQAITRGVHKVLQHAAIAREQVIGITGTGQWSVTVPVGDDGRPLMRAVHWMDSRGAPYTKAITNGFPRVAGYGLRKLAKWIRITGGVPTHSGNDALAHVLYIKHGQPDVYRQTRGMLEPTDYLGLRLTGRMAATQATIYPYLLTDNRHLSMLITIRALEINRRGPGQDARSCARDVRARSVLPEVAEEWGLGRARPSRGGLRRHVGRGRGFGRGARITTGIFVSGRHPG